jgi:tripartite-type tricarboxylate transporter receptor subunit TctC
MAPRLFRALRACLLVAAGLLAPRAASADPVADFYAGRTMIMLVGYEAGSGNDILARLVAKHMRDHLPGAPTFVVQNMPGVASLKAANYLYNVAPRDGSVVATIGRNIPTAPLLDTANAKFDARKFTWLGSVSRTVTLAMAWHASPVKSLADATRMELIVGAPAATSEAARLPLIYNATIGTRFKVITGYPEPQIALAMERGELAGQAAVSLDSLFAAHGDWIRNRQVTLLMQSGFAPDARIPDVPLGIDHAKSPADRQLLAFIGLPYEMSRPFAAPPGLPPERAAALVEAMRATIADPDFRADAAQAKIDVIAPASAAEIATLIDKIYATPAAVVARARKLLGTN